jgi:hypothetical protein
MYNSSNSTERSVPLLPATKTTLPMTRLRGRQRDGRQHGQRVTAHNFLTQGLILLIGTINRSCVSVAKIVGDMLKDCEEEIDKVEARMFCHYCGPMSRIEFHNCVKSYNIFHASMDCSSFNGCDSVISNHIVRDIRDQYPPPFPINSR